MRLDQYNSPTCCPHPIVWFSRPHISCECGNCSVLIAHEHGGLRAPLPGRARNHPRVNHVLNGDRRLKVAHGFRGPFALHRPRPSPTARAFISSFPRKREPRAPGPRRSPLGPRLRGADGTDHVPQYRDHEQSRRPMAHPHPNPPPLAGEGREGAAGRLVGATTLRVRPTPQRPLSPCVINPVAASAMPNPLYPVIKSNRIPSGGDRGSALPRRHNQ
jgi:hypothetical protein